MKREPDKVFSEDTPPTVSGAHKSSVGRAATLIFLCFVASFLGSWVFLRTGLVQQDATQTIKHNRQSIVVQEAR